MKIKKLIIAGVCLLFSMVSAFAQKTMQVTTYDLGSAVPLAANDGETVVIIKSTLPLEFESTMDKTLDIYNYKEEGIYKFYYIKFVVDKRHRGRKLIIKSFGFENFKQPLELTAKVPVAYSVVDPNGTVGVGCYFEHLNKGNDFFAKTQYADAKSEYYLALECKDMPEDNDLSQKIEDAAMALDSKTSADNYFNSGQYIEAKREYEKLHGLNPNDRYPIGRIIICNNRIPNLPRTITVKVTDKDGKIMSGVAFSTDEFKTDKHGNLKLDENGKPQKKNGFVQTTASFNQNTGIYTVKIKYVNTELALRKYIDGKSEYYDEYQLSPTLDELNVKLIKTKMTSAEKTSQFIKLGNDLIKQLDKK